MACDVVSVGTISTKMFNGITSILKDIRYVPNLRINLLSLKTLDETHFTFKAK